MGDQGSKSWDYKKNLSGFGIMNFKYVRILGLCQDLKVFISKNLIYKKKFKIFYEKNQRFTIFEKN